jgi:hypothetical protein
LPDASCQDVSTHAAATVPTADTPLRFRVTTIGENVDTDPPGDCTVNESGPTVPATLDDACETIFTLPSCSVRYSVPSPP